MLKQLCGEHTIDVDLLPEAPLVLDAGCRTFNFCEEIFALRPNARIVGIDAGPDVELPEGESRITLLRYALMEGISDRVWLKMAGCESITSTTPVPGWAQVPVTSLEIILAHWPYFDLIKFDIEGSEFGILENWPGRCATQINIEFHDNRKSTDGKGLPQSYFDRLFAEKLPDYRVVQNEPDECGTHADCLLVLKPS